MTFTTKTIRDLRALNLEDHVFERVLEIFEAAREAKPKKKGGAADRAARGTRLADDWALPDAWRDWALGVGLRANEVQREATRFKNYWLNAAGAKGIKLKWDLTWQNWCMSTLERAGRTPLTPSPAGTAAAATAPETFTDATWKAIAGRYGATRQWNPEWGPPPGRMDCQMPANLLPPDMR